MQQALIPIAAAAGLVALAGGAAALFWRSPDSTPELEEEDKEEDEEEDKEEDEEEDEEEDKEEDKELEAVEKEPPRGSVAVETCTVEQQLQAIKDDIVSKVRKGEYNRKRALHEWIRQSLQITTQPNTKRCRVPPNYINGLWHEIDKEFK